MFQVVLLSPLEHIAQSAMNSQLSTPPHSVADSTQHIVGMRRLGKVSMLANIITSWNIEISKEHPSCSNLPQPHMFVRSANVLWRHKTPPLWTRNGVLIFGPWYPLSLGSTFWSKILRDSIINLCLGQGFPKNLLTLPARMISMGLSKPTTGSRSVIPGVLFVHYFPVGVRCPQGPGARGWAWQRQRDFCFLREEVFYGQGGLWIHDPLVGGRTHRVRNNL